VRSTINREPDLLRWSYVVLALDHTKYEDAFLKGARLKTPGRNVPTRRAVEAQAVFPWLAPAAETRRIPNLPLRKVLPSGVQVGCQPRHSPDGFATAPLLPPAREGPHVAVTQDLRGPDPLRTATSSHPSAMAAVDRLGNECKARSALRGRCPLQHE